MSNHRRRIGLKIPSAKRWSWDARFGHALEGYEKEDRERALLPLALEFEQKSNMDIIGRALPHINEFVQSAIGVMPSHNIFVAQAQPHTKLVI